MADPIPVSLCIRAAKLARQDCDAATPGPWKVYETRHPYKLGDRDGFHVERKIGTAGDHPQLHAPAPVVTLSSGIGPATFVSISDADAHLIAAAPDLLDTLKRVAMWCHSGHGFFPARQCGVCAPVLAAIAKAEGR